MDKLRREYITLTPKGYRFRTNIFRNVGKLIEWFKKHWKNPIPQSKRERVKIVVPGQTNDFGRTQNQFNNLPPQGFVPNLQRNPFNPPIIAPMIVQPPLNNTSQESYDDIYF